VDVEIGDVLFWSLSRSTWRRQGSAIYYADPISELLVNNEELVFLRLAAVTPVDKMTTMRRYFFSTSHIRTQSDLFHVVNPNRGFEVFGEVTAWLEPGVDPFRGTRNLGDFS
jgi:hypothetical protein